MNFSPESGLADFDFTSFFGRLDRLTLRSRKRVTGREVGGRLSTKKGRGLEPVGYRAYEPGDPLQMVDWAAYARTEKLFVREYEEERALQTRILLDTSRSMGFGEKMGFAGKVAAGIAYLVEGENEAFGLSTFDDSLDPGRTGRGRLHLMDLVGRLESLEASGETDVLGAVEEASDIMQIRSLVVLVSDFMDDQDRLEDAVHHLREHDVILVQVLEPGEIAPEMDGDLLLTDSETGEEVEVYLSDRTRKRYRRMANRQAAEIGRLAREVEGDHLAFVTSRPPLEAMFDLVSRR